MLRKIPESQRVNVNPWKLTNPLWVSISRSNAANGNIESSPKGEMRRVGHNSQPMPHVFRLFQVSWPKHQLETYAAKLLMLSLTHDRLDYHKEPCSKASPER